MKRGFLLPSNQRLSACDVCLCVCARTYKQVVNTLTHPRSCSSCLSALAASFYWQLLADADMLCARIPISRMCSLAALMFALKHTEAVPVAFASIVVIPAFRHQCESSPPNQMRQQGGVLRCPSRWCVRQHGQSLAHVSEWRKCKINTMDNADICGLNCRASGWMILFHLVILRIHTPNQPTWDGSSMWGVYYPKGHFASALAALLAWQSWSVHYKPRLVHQLCSWVWNHLCNYTQSTWTDLNGLIKPNMIIHKQDRCPL